MNRRRRYWLRLCFGWAAFWALTLLVGFLPALLLIPFSLALALLPVGVGLDEKYREMETTLRKEFDR